ncbi:hypothetical protein BGZ60DRAFT_118002 [Tricladium varicosporioides]|nr:hypothetical protein BGZ60DRAFT_118002 [Hymenoscyphus varicosporioides]
MAITEETIHHATDDLLLEKPRKYYRALIHKDHWQLRALVSSPQQNVVYYPSGADIIRLNTRNGERETIATLSFAPKCLSATEQWLCAGGDKGNYIAICLDESKWGNVSLITDADADARLPLDLDPASRTMLREIIREASTTTEGHSTARRSRGTRSAKTTKVGTDLVNSIGLWSPNHAATEKAYKVPVALVSNNDKTVSIMDIAESDLLDELSFPDCVNRAVMSADGEMLLVVGDDPFMYVHERVEKPRAKNRRFEVKQSVRYQWVLRRRIQIEGEKQGDKSAMRGIFAVCFSNSGKYLAVATQRGLISVFDATTLAQEDIDSLIVVFTTSRPGPDTAKIGGVRAMAFSPGPFDLLAWTESSGRFGIADVRNLFYSRQLVLLDAHAEGIERVRLTERVGDTLVDPRLRNSRADSPSSNSTPDYLGLDLERRHLRHVAREMTNRDQAPLTAEELEVLSAHRIARRQRDLANAAREARIEALAEAVARSNDRSNDRLNDELPTPSGTSSNRTSSTERERRTALANLPPILREFVNPERSTTSIRSYINDRNQDRERRSQMEPEALRRLNLIQLAAAETAVERGSRTNHDTSSSLERLTLTPPPRLPPTGSESASNPWAELDTLYRARHAAEALVDRSSRLRVEIENEDRQDFANRLRQPWRPLDDIARAEREGTLRGHLTPGTAETMGLSWSPDGRILYIGAEDGIYEYHVNITGRKKFPSVVMR